MEAVSLFSNCGAGDVGYNAAGFDFWVMAELARQRLDVCLLNHPGAIGVQGDLRETWRDVVADWFIEHRYDRTQRPDLLCACPPCQGMSSARSYKTQDSTSEQPRHDERNLLVEVVADVIQCLRPRVVVLENVPQFLTKLVPHPETGIGISAPRLLHERIGQEYYFFPIVVNLADYGVPQSRKRSFITLVRRDEPWLVPMLEQGLTPFPAFTHEKNHVTFGKHFANNPLPALDPRSTETAADPNDPLHAVSVWANGDRRYAMIEATKLDGGSAWHNTACELGCDNREQTINATDAVCPQCGEALLRPIVRNPDGSVRLISGFPTSYRRIDSREVASTVTTASGHIGSDVNIHPTQHRLLSPRECARLQTFPEDFKWGKILEDRVMGKIREMIGEAVPPRFTELHGQVLQELLQGNVNPESLLSADHVCHTRAVSKLNVPQQAVPALNE